MGRFRQREAWKSKKKGLRTGNDDVENSTSDRKRLRVNTLDGAGKSKGGSDVPEPDADKPLTKENLRVSNLPGESLIAKPDSSRVAVKPELADEQTGKDNGGKEGESGISRFRQDSPLQPPPELPLQEHLGDVQSKPVPKPEPYKPKLMSDIVEKPGTGHENSTFHSPFGRLQ